MQNQSQNIPVQTLNIKFMVKQSLRLRACFHIQAKSVFQQLLFYQVIQNIQAHFDIRESLSLFSPSRYTFLFFKKNLCFDP